MKILLDENLDHRLRSVLTGHDVSTVRHMNWLGTKNGALLALAQSNGFEALITRDQSLPYQQNIPNCVLRVVIVRGFPNDLPHLVTQAASALATMRPGEVRRIG